MFLHVAAPKKPRAREPHQLPAGRHGLSGTFVSAHQRRRIMTAVAEVCGSVGYVRMSVQDVVIAAGVSRKTFYTNYSDKEDAFLAAYDDACERVVGQVVKAYGSADTLVDRTRASLRTLLTAIAAEPDTASMCLVEVLAAGPAALERRNAMMREVSEFVDRTAADCLPASRRPSPLVAETLVGGIYEALASRAMTGRVAELPGLLPDLMFALLLPYVGAEAAHKILRRERQRLSRSLAAASRSA
jgi:AcrR family transcriptional regulator